MNYIEIEMLYIIGIIIDFLCIPAAGLIAIAGVVYLAFPEWCRRHKTRLFCAAAVIIAIYGTVLICTESEGCETDWNRIASEKRLEAQRMINNASKALADEYNERQRDNMDRWQREKEMYLYIRSKTDAECAKDQFDNWKTFERNRR